MLDKLKNAHRAEYCSLVQSEGPYDDEDIFFVAQVIFKSLDDIDSLEVLKCFVETMNLTLDEAFGEDDETLLFPAVKFGRPKSVKHLASEIWLF